MAEQIQVWLGGNAAGPADPEPAEVLSAPDAADVLQVQLLMDDAPDGWFGQTQWNRLLAEDPPPPTEVRTNGIGSLLFGMTRAEVDASGIAMVDEPEPGADPPEAWNAAGQWNRRSPPGQTTITCAPGHVFAGQHWPNAVRSASTDQRSKLFEVTDKY